MHDRRWCCAVNTCAAGGMGCGPGADSGIHCVHGMPALAGVGGGQGSAEITEVDHDGLPRTSQRFSALLHNLFHLEPHDGRFL